MADHTVRWGPVETEMMNKIFEPEVLRREIPGIGDVLDGAAHMRTMNEEIGILGRFHKAAAGFTEGHGMHRTSKIDTNIQVMLEELHEAGCSCGKGLWGPKGHKNWYYKWLEGPGKNFDVRGKICL